MIHRLATLDQAVIFAAERQNEGYFAEVIHINSGHLWGSLATNGFAVIVSEHAAEEDQIVPSEKSAIPWILSILGYVVCIFSLITVSLVGLALFISLLVFMFSSPLALVGILLFAAIVFACFCIFNHWILFTYSAYRDLEHRCHTPMQFAYRSIAFVLAIVAPLLM